MEFLLFLVKNVLNLYLRTLLVRDLLQKDDIINMFHRENEPQSPFMDSTEDTIEELENVGPSISGWHPFRSWPSNRKTPI